MTNDWDLFLKKSVHPSNGRVDYLGIEKGGRPALEKILAQFGGTPGVEKFTDAGKKAFFINFYNAGMIFNILRYAKEEKIDVGSPAFLQLKINDLKVSGGNIWNGSYKFKFAGQDVTLDGIEHDLIRGKASGVLAPYKVAKLDPRIHIAVNCAAISCPRVREKAYTADNIDKMLDENLRATLANPLHFAKLSDKKLKINAIFQWYYSDFDDYARGAKLTGAGDYLVGFIGKDVADGDWLKKFLQANFNDRNALSLRVSNSFDFNYNWQINDKRN